MTRCAHRIRKTRMPIMRGITFGMADEIWVLHADKRAQHTTNIYIYIYVHIFIYIYIYVSIYSYIYVNIQI